MRAIRFLASIALLTGSLVGFNSCNAIEGVGDPCVPEDEYDHTFAGFSMSEVNVESRSFSCQTRICLVNHFQGRVSCPYGQTEAQGKACAVPATGVSADTLAPLCLPGSPEYALSCRIPNTNGTQVADRVQPKVLPQKTERRADDAVYCSCRCDGPDAGARYCECPDGFSCEKLVEKLNLGRGQLAGSYCVKSGTSFNPLTPPSTECDAGAKNCGNNGANP